MIQINTDRCEVMRIVFQIITRSLRIVRAAVLEIRQGDRNYAVNDVVYTAPLVAPSPGYSTTATRVIPRR